MMTVPTYDVLMLPVLRLAGEHAWTARDLVARIADDFQLTEEERSKLRPKSHRRTVLADRVAWSVTYLVQARLLDRPERGSVQITARGRDVLGKNPEKLDATFLEQFEEFRNFRQRSKHLTTLDAALNANAPAVLDAASALETHTPEDQINAASNALDVTLREELLAQVRKMPPSFFEKVIIDLLLAMGYGGSRSDAGEHLGRTGDGGVDGVIREDQLGLDRVYLQAKRYQEGSTLGSPAVQAFIGALVNKGASKGVLITTSTFSEAATEAARQSGQYHLVLMDGEQLANLMVRFNVGVRVTETVEIKRIDQDYFDAGLSE